LEERKFAIKIYPFDLFLGDFVSHCRATVALPTQSSRDCDIFENSTTLVSSFDFIQSEAQKNGAPKVSRFWDDQFIFRDPVQIVLRATEGIGGIIPQSPFTFIHRSFTVNRL
jgi:hypothetical protein